MHDQRIQQRYGQRDRREASHRIVAGLFVNGGIHRERPDRSEHDRIAVRRRARPDFVAEHAARAGAIVDHDLLPPRLPRCSASTRATMSEEPPGANATIMRTGLTG